MSTATGSMHAKQLTNDIERIFWTNIRRSLRNVYAIVELSWRLKSWLFTLPYQAGVASRGHGDPLDTIPRDMEGISLIYIPWDI